MVVAVVSKVVVIAIVDGSNSQLFSLWLTIVLVIVVVVVVEAAGVLLPLLRPHFTNKKYDNDD